MAAPVKRPAYDETSPRYAGWRVVLACFLVALFIFGFGLYGHGVYVAELQRLRGWAASLVSGAITLTSCSAAYSQHLHTNSSRSLDRSASFCLESRR